MKNIKKLRTLLLMLSISAGIVLPLLTISTATQAADKPAVKEKWIEVSIEATVTGIDKKKREVTLKDKDGEEMTISVGDEVKRFDEIEVGDQVEALYWTFLRAEFREPTAEEKENPLVVLADAGRAPKDVDPAAAVGAVVKAVVKVIVIDKENKEAMIEGPRGNKLIVPVMDDAVLNNLKIGEQVIMTYAEAMAVALTKEEK